MSLSLSVMSFSPSVRMLVTHVLLGVRRLPLALLALLVHAGTLVHVVHVEVGFALGLRHFGAQALLKNHLLVGQTLAQVRPLEPVQVLPRPRFPVSDVLARRIASGRRTLMHQRSDTKVWRLRVAMGVL